MENPEAPELEAVVVSQLAGPQARPEQNPEQSVGQSEEPAEVKADPLHWLTPAEKYAYNTFLKKQEEGGSDTFPISKTTQEGMLALFLNGKTLEEIRKVNLQFGLGQIVHMAVESGWYDTRETYLNTMVQRAKVRAIQATAEGLELTADIMAALKKQHGGNISRFLQTGNIKDLGNATSINLVRQLKDLGDLLAKLTGGDQVRNVRVQGVVEHTGGVAVFPSQQASSEKLLQWAQEKKALELKKFGG